MGWSRNKLRANPVTCWSTEHLLVTIICPVLNYFYPKTWYVGCVWSLVSHAIQQKNFHPEHGKWKPPNRPHLHLKHLAGPPRGRTHVFINWLMLFDLEGFVCKRRCTVMYSRLIIFEKVNLRLFWSYEAGGTRESFHENGWDDGSLPVDMASLSHYVRPVFIHLRWWFGISEPSTVVTRDNLAEKICDDTLPDSLKLNSSPLKIDDWKTCFLLGLPIFRGLMLTFRGGYGISHFNHLGGLMVGRWSFAFEAISACL